MKTLALGAAMAVVSAGGAAQDVGHFPHRDGVVAQSAISAAMGRCALKRNRRDAVMLVTAANAAAEQRAVARIRADMITCLGSAHSATLNGLHVTGAMAEALLNENGGALLARADSLPTVTPVRVVVAEGAPRAVIACATRAAPLTAAELLRANAETPAEMAAFRKMAPALQACAPAAGSVAIRPDIVRAAIAIATYRRLAASDEQ